MKRFFIYVFILIAISARATDTLSYKVRNINDWAFYNNQKPTLEFVGINNNKQQINYNVHCNILNYKKEPIYSLGQTGVVLPKDTTCSSFSFKAIEPGFYRVEFIDYKRKSKQGINIAYNPQKIEIQDIGDENFKKFLLLLQIDLKREPLVSHTEINESLSGRERVIYNVKINTLKGNSVEGYLAIPRSGKSFSAIVSFVYEENRQRNPLANFTAGINMAELVVFVKNKEFNKTTSYYNEIMATSINCINYICSKQEIDNTKVFVKGSGVGGAYALIACAASDKIVAGVIENPVLDNFINFFRINTIGESIKKPILLGFGLQLDIEELQKIFSIFNFIKVEKEYFGFPLAKNVLPDKWKNIRDNFLNKF